MEVKQTSQYDMFSYIQANRPISKGHVAFLTRAIADNNLLHLAPILVNSDLQVIDGQHRLEAAKTLKVPVYYMVDSKATATEAMVLNTVLNKWTVKHFVNSYAERRNENYIQLKQLIEDYNCSASVGAWLLSSVEPDKSLLRSYQTIIKNGSFIVRIYDKAEETLTELTKIGKYCKRRFYTNREFVFAYLTLKKQIKAKAFLEMLEKVKPVLEAKVSWRDHLEAFEKVYFKATGKSIHL